MSLAAPSSGNYAVGNASAFPTCNNQSLSSPNIFGTEIISVQATPIANFTLASGPSAVFTKSQFSGLDFCNVTVQYTHPGYNDNITVTILLPPEDAWNGNFVGAGGGGWSATGGGATTLPAVDAGYSVATTDAGVSINSISSEDWALLGLGNPDIIRLNTFASRGLHEMAVVGKSVTSDYYGQAARYSYWIGCSQGGRQGIQHAQRYPDDYDGIAAIAPAVNYGQLFGALNWAHQIMHEVNYYPRRCEVLAFTAAAVQACDELDGVADGVISFTSCTFNPFGVVGKSFDCDGENATFTTGGAKVMHAAWQGTRSTEDDFLWYGYHPDANLQAAVASTICSTGSNCTAAPFSLGEDWIRLWIAADPSLDLSNLTRADYESLIADGVQRYDSIIGTRNADLSRFRKSGGKMITWHGLSDELIPFAGSTDYYDRVRENDENVDDYFRLFLAPGTAHCVPGTGQFPVNVLPDLVNWVEHGNAPTKLAAQNITGIDPSTGLLASGNATTRGRPLCLYPLVQKYIGGEPDVQSSFKCVKA